MKKTNKIIERDEFKVPLSKSKKIQDSKSWFLNKVIVTIVAIFDTNAIITTTRIIVIIIVTITTTTTTTTTSSVGISSWDIVTDHGRWE